MSMLYNNSEGFVVCLTSSCYTEGNDYKWLHTFWSSYIHVHIFTSLHPEVSQQQKNITTVNQKKKNKTHCSNSAQTDHWNALYHTQEKAKKQEDQMLKQRLSAILLHNLSTVIFLT